MKKIFILIITLISISSFAQKQTAHWFFGAQAGLDFNSGDPVSIDGSQMTTFEGCATISDPNGFLLFYTDGITIWNKNHEVMVNGDNLNGDNSSTNSAIIIPKPNNPNLYYVFTVDAVAGPEGLQYSEVNMLLDAGLGGVNSNKNITLQTSTLEKLTAVKHQNDIDWWVLSHKWNSNEFIVYNVSNSGISAPIISSPGLNISGVTSSTIGCVKLSPNGSKVAIAHSYDNNLIQLFDFNDSNGVVSNPITLGGFETGTITNRGVYGVEFSPDSKLLYASDSGGSLYQYNTNLPTASEIINSRIKIANSITGLGAIQIAPNSKIYVAKENDSYLGVIERPNEIGLNSNYTSNGIFLDSGSSRLGLPPFIQSYFWKAITADYTCLGDNTEFTLINPEVSQIWNFDDPTSGVNNTSTDVNPTHIYTDTGTYVVTVEVTNSLGEHSMSTINVVISETPAATKPQDYILCDNDFDTNSNNGIIQSFLLSTIDSEILNSQNPDIFDVFYYEDINHTLKINKTEDYENIIANSQIIYAKIFNKNNNLCFDTTEFNLIVNEIPAFDLAEEKIICSNILPDSVQIDNAQGNYTYEWRLEDNTLFSNDDNLTFNDVLSIPTYGLQLILTATASNNCSNSKSILIRKIEPITFTQNDIIVNDLSNNNTITINPQNPNFNPEEYEYAIIDENGNVSLYQNELIFEHVTPGIKTVLIRDIYKCDIIEIEVSVIGFPHFFTPNNDGFNDTWHVLGVSKTFYSNSIIRIFDRFGKIIANINSSDDGWDGLYNGKELPETDYWFSAQIIDNAGNKREQKGHFSLIRR